MSAARRADVRLFEGARDVFIADSAFRVEITQSTGIDGLKQIIAPSAFHNSGECYDPPRCHPRTRKALLGRIMSWVRGVIDTEALIFWLNGSVGVGKSAIGQTIAEMCEREGLLLASFFFGRSDPARNNAKHFVTTLAYQVALAVPHARHRIEQAFEHDPVIHTRSLETQIMKLVIEPLGQATAVQIGIPPLVVVDGLDECADRAMQCKILSLIHQASWSLATIGHRLIFLVGSRPEQEISLLFNSSPIQDITIHYTLGDCVDSDDDIRRFLEDRFEAIKKSHPIKNSIPSSWPRSEDINELVWRASGQFLYAHIVIEYTSSIRHRPFDRLAELLTLPSQQANNPFADLDVLYTHIFSSVQSVESVLKILGLCLTKFSSEDLAFSDIVRNRLGLGYEDVKLLFGDLSSVVDIVYTLERGSYTWEMNLRHASLEEFLTNQHRSKKFFVDIEPSVAEWVTWVLRNNLVDHPQHVDDLEAAFRKLKSSKSQLLHDVLRDCHLALLLSKPSLQLASVQLSRFVYSAITAIKHMPFEDAEILYETQLQSFESQVQLILGRFYSPVVYFPLLLKGFTTRAPRHTESALCDMLRIERKELDTRDPLGFTWRGRQWSQFFSFLSTFIHDPTRSFEYAMDGVKLAEAALALFRFLCYPKLSTNIFGKFLSSYTELLKYRPWTSRRMRLSRSNTAPRKWFKWRFCDHCARAHTTKESCIGYDQFVPTLAYLSSHRSSLIILHTSHELLGYRFALTFLSDILAAASRSAELVECCKEYVFHSTSILFPHKSKIARRAISEYLERMEAKEQGS